MSAAIYDGYRPTKHAKSAHACDARGVAISGGWRAGKSLGAGMEGLPWMAGFASLIWIIGKDYDTARQEFIYMAEGAESTGLAVPNDIRISLNKYTPCTMRSITGCIVETRTLADFRKIASKAPDVVIVCEPGIIDNLSALMELLRGRVAEKRGVIILAGTSDESSEEWFQLWERWNAPNPEDGRSFSIPTWDNTYKFPKGKKEQEFITYEEMYGTEQLMAHYGGVPASPRGLVLRGFWREDTHVDPRLVWTPTLPTEIAIDPNYSLGHRYTLEVLQWNLETGKMFLVDEVAEEGLTHDQMRDIAKERPWFPYVTGGTIDPYAEAHVFGHYLPSSYWLPFKLRTEHRPRVATTVQSLREACTVDGDGTPRLTVAERAVRFREEAKKWRTTRTGEPSKDWCDAMKATGYWLNDRFAIERMDYDDDESNEVVTSDWNYG